MGTRHSRNTVSHNERCEPQKEEYKCSRDSREAKPHSTKQSKTECQRVEVPCAHHLLEFSYLERETRAVFTCFYKKPFLPGSRLKLNLIYCIRPPSRIIYTHYDDVICKYLLVSIALNYGLAFWFMRIWVGILVYEEAP